MQNLKETFFRFLPFGKLDASIGKRWYVGATSEVRKLYEERKVNHQKSLAGTMTGHHCEDDK